MKNFKRIIALALSTIMLLTTVACTSQKDSDPKGNMDTTADKGLPVIGGHCSV